LQRFIPLKKKIKQRKPDESVNIEGKQVTWGSFSKKFYEDLERQINKGEDVKYKDFIINKGDINKEKMLEWS